MRRLFPDLTWLILYWPPTRLRLLGLRHNRYTISFAAPRGRRLGSGVAPGAGLARRWGRGVASVRPLEAPRSSPASRVLCSAALTPCTDAFSSTAVCRSCRAPARPAAPSATAGPARGTPTTWVTTSAALAPPTAWRIASSPVDRARWAQRAEGRRCRTRRCTFRCGP